MLSEIAVGRSRCPAAAVVAPRMLHRGQRVWPASGHLPTPVSATHRVPVICAACSGPKHFAFVGSQYHLEVGGQDYYLDLLFYHLRLRCYVVLDLKVREFQPEDAGKMNFYLSAADDLLRHPDDQPSIGLILCKEHNRVVAEYALRDMSKPIGVSAYQLTAALPEKLQGSLPSIEELEAGLRATPDGE